MSGGELPNVRRVRTNIFGDVDQPSPDHNLFVMQFGQILAHDTQLVVYKGAGEFEQKFYKTITFFFTSEPNAIVPSFRGGLVARGVSEIYLLGLLRIRTINFT